MKTILITGGRGFIGKNLIEFFRDRYNIIAPSRQEVDFTNEESVDKFFKENKVDYVVHLAAKGARRNDNYINILPDNLAMYLNLSRNKRYYKRMIVMGSGAEYDKRRSIYKMKEDETQMTDDHYGRSKYYIGQYVKDQDDKIVLLRGFGIYGKYEESDIRFISNTILGALKGKIVVNNPKAKFDYLWVVDLCRLIEFFMLDKNLKYNIYNVGSGKDIELLALAKLIQQIVNPKAKLVVDDKGDGNHFVPDVKRLREQYPFMNYTSLKFGIETLKRWYENGRHKE